MFSGSEALSGKYCLEIWFSERLVFRNLPRGDNGLEIVSQTVVHLKYSNNPTDMIAFSVRGDISLEMEPCKIRTCIVGNFSGRRTADAANDIYP